MNKWMIPVIAGIMAVSITSCKSGGNRETAPSETEESPAAVQTEASSLAAGEEEEIPNPFQQVEDPKGLEEIGLSMEIPEEASSVECYIISGEIGEVSFELDGKKYSYRGAVHAEDFAGIFEEFEPEVTSVSDCGADEDLLVKTTVSGGRLASWSKNGAKYTLYTPSAATDEEIFELCINLISKN